jgi:hypothetical protein
LDLSYQPVTAIIAQMFGRRTDGARTPEDVKYAGDPLGLGRLIVHDEP